MKLKDTGVWVDESSQIESMFVNDFTTIFKSAQASTSSMQLDMFNSVTIDDSEKLLEPI